MTIICKACGRSRDVHPGYWKNRPNGGFCSRACWVAAPKPAKTFGRPAGPITDRFWPHVLKCNGCWMWNGRINNKGYGVMDAEGPRRGRPVFAHRISYQLASGEPIPDGLCVLHRCDNPPCVNPDHLFLGTKTDNNRDAAAKGHFSTPARVAAGTRSLIKATEVRLAKWRTRKAALADLVAPISDVERLVEETQRAR